MVNGNINNFESRLSGIENDIVQLKSDVNQNAMRQKEIPQEIKKWVKLWIFGGFSLLAVISWISLYITIYNGVKDKTEKLITKEITHKFAEPQIAQTFKDITENEGRKIIESNITPKVEESEATISKLEKEARLTINQNITSFETKIQEFKNKYDKELEKLAKEVEYIKKRNDILRLGDTAIAAGDVTSFDKLENIYNNSTDKNIRMIALSEIFRVKGIFLSGSRVEGINIIYTDPKTKKKFKNDEIPTNILIQELKGIKPWRYRAVIARLLGNRKEKGIPEVLLETVRNDPNLEVRKEAMRSFESVTGFKKRDIFNYKSVSKWWQENKARVERVLGNSQTIKLRLEKDKN